MQIFLSHINFKTLGYFLMLVTMVRGVTSCQDKKSKCDYEYFDATNTYCVLGKLKGNIEEDLMLFYDMRSGNEFSETGFFKDGFRNDMWQYNHDNKPDSIVWGYYKDKYLNYETNTFSQADSTKYGPNFTKLKYTNTLGSIILGISIDGPIKDSLPEQNYEQLARSQFRLIDVNVTDIKSNKLSNGATDIYVYELHVNSMGPDSNKKTVLRNYFCRLDNHFLEISVSYTKENSFLGEALFNAVLTNSYLNKKRVYFPFKK